LHGGLWQAGVRRVFDLLNWESHRKQATGGGPEGKGRGGLGWGG